jgi:RNA polymerase sigma factor (TIGR02999 family)
VSQSYKTAQQSSQSVTDLLVQWRQGDRDALEKLTPLVYDELHRLAGGYLRNQRPDHTLQATALIHEAYVRLLDIDEIEWQSRAHFICLMAQLMRRVLVDHARKHHAQKRGGAALKLSLSRAERAASEPDFDLVELNETLERFAERFPRQAKVIELHFFGGLRVEEIPKVLSGDGDPMSTRTVERDLKFARAWLRKEIEDQ